MELSESLNGLPEYIQLIHNLKMRGYVTDDMHWGNVGYMPDGRFVAIDFDRA